MPFILESYWNNLDFLLNIPSFDSSGETEQNKSDQSKRRNRQSSVRKVRLGMLSDRWRPRPA